MRCRCKKETDAADRQQTLIKFCNLPEGTEHKTLGNFKTYRDESLIEALAASRSISSGDGEIIFLTLISESDKGKSHLAIGICREWLARNQSACYANVSRVLNELRDGFDREGENSFRSRLNFYCRVGILALDDLGTEKITDWGAEQLQTIINSRYDDKLHTVVTTNRPIDDLFNYADKRDGWRELANMRVSSRLQREYWCKVIVIDTIPHIERKDYRRHDEQGSN